MAKKDPSKTTTVAGSAGASPAPAGANDHDNLKALLAEAESALDAKGEDQDRPTPEEFAAQMKGPADLDLLRKTLAIAEANAAAKSEVSGEPEELVRVYHLNRSKGSFLHGEYRLAPGSSAVVPKSVADLWIGHTDGTGKPHVALSEAEVQAPDTEKAKLRDENDELSQRVKALEAQLAAAHSAALGKQEQE